jgi:hypothetical protein
MSDFGPPEHVYVESDYCDGPRSGIANVDGVPHRFVCQFDETGQKWSDAFLVEPIDEETLVLEIEQYRIFVDWNDRNEGNDVMASSHPGNGGIDTRWDEIEAILQRRRAIDSARARAARARFIPVEGLARYHRNGTNSLVRWAFA